MLWVLIRIASYEHPHVREKLAKIIVQLSSNIYPTILGFPTTLSGQTVQTQIRLTDQGIHCLKNSMFWRHLSTLLLGNF